MAASNGLISVAMCTHNGAAFLADQLQSIIAQDCQPREMMVCDDRSTDRTLDLLRSFSRRAGFPVRIEINRVRLGVTKNFQKAISMCDGAIVALADQDDVWKPHKLATFAEAFQKHPDASYAFSDAEILSNQRCRDTSTLWKSLGFCDVLGDFNSHKQFNILLKRSYVTGAAMAFRSSIKHLAFPIPDGWIHDHWLSLLGSAVSYGVALPDPLFAYRRHQDQVVGVGKNTVWQQARISVRTGPSGWSQKLAQLEDLERRVSALVADSRCSAEFLKLVRAKLQHFSKRRDIRSTNGIKRLRLQFAEILSGRYGQFSPSWCSIVRDLLG